MRSVFRSIQALGAFFVLAIVVAGCGGGGVPGDSVADVSGNPLTMATFNHWMFIAAKGQSSQSPGSPVIVPDPPNYTKCVATVRKSIPSLASTPAKTLKTECGTLFTQLRDQVMDFLIRSYWYKADAAKQNIKVTDAQVQKAFQSAKAQQFPTDARFQAFLASSGMTLNDILYRVRVNQVYTKLLAKSGATVTSAQIAAYYAAHATQFGKPATRNIRIILTKTKAQADAAKAALAGGATWQAVAAKYSTDAATKNKGGLLVNVTKGQQDAALDQAAFSASRGVLLGPVQGQFGWYVFEVTSVTPGNQQTLAQATPTIKQLLTQQNSTAQQAKVDAAAKKNWLSKTECRAGYVMADCHGYKAPAKTTSTTTTPTTATTTPSTTTTG
jgi:foldase protein PrsA